MELNRRSAKTAPNAAQLSTTVSLRYCHDAAFLMHALLRLYARVSRGVHVAPGCDDVYVRQNRASPTNCIHTSTCLLVCIYICVCVLDEHCADKIWPKAATDFASFATHCRNMNLCRYVRRYLCNVCACVYRRMRSDAAISTLAMFQLRRKARMKEKER